MKKQKKTTTPTHPADSGPAGSTALEQFAAQGLDEKSGLEALARLKPLLDKQPGDPSAAPRLNTQLAASATLAVVQAVDELALRPRLKQQADIGEFELAYLELLPDVARASLFLRREVSRTEAQGSDAQLPESLVTQAYAVRSRMFRGLNFLFENDPKVSLDLTAIRSGTGYRDMADDLTALGGLYDLHDKILAAGTPLNYRASDRTEAAQLASRIVAELAKAFGQTGHSVREQQLAQVTTLLATAYDEVAATCRHLCRHNPAQVERFPSLFTATRVRTRRPAAAPGPAEPDDANS